MNEVSPVMLAGPKRAVSGPDRAAPGRTGSSRTVGGLISERPVFVNVANGRDPGPQIGRNWPEYIRFRGVFQASKDSGASRGSLDAAPGKTLAIRNLTAPEPGCILKT
jgi:hypothetical protein